jgi:hypothetical protein
MSSIAARDDVSHRDFSRVPRLRAEGSDATGASTERDRSSATTFSGLARRISSSAEGCEERPATSPLRLAMSRYSRTFSAEAASQSAKAPCSVGPDSGSRRRTNHAAASSVIRSL